MNRDEIINLLIRKYKYNSYLEIGVYDGANFAKINCPHKVGVDPDPKTKATVFKYSDEFFADNTEKFDIVFIDGLHHWEQVARDIENSLRVLNFGGTVVMHDCNPTTKAMQQVPRIQGEWTGDTWKAFIHFRRNADLKMFCINTDYGVGIIQKGEQMQKPLIVESPTYEQFEINKKEWLNLISVNEFSKENPKISVCIPAFEQYGYGVKHLRALFHSLASQAGNFEVVVSDNSKNEEIEDFCEATKRVTTLNIRHIYNKNVGISENTNNAIRNAKSDFIKIMYMDDLLLHNNALIEFIKALENHPWATSYARSIDANGLVFKPHVPKWNPDILYGKNTIGMPSMLAVRKNEFEFDVNLKTRLDCDYMYMLYKAYGPPVVIPKFLIGQRYWDKSTSRVQGNLTHVEVDYLKQKHNLV